jgi:hypothetical protein
MRKLKPSDGVRINNGRVELAVWQPVSIDVAAQRIASVRNISYQSGRRIVQQSLQLETREGSVKTLQQIIDENPDVCDECDSDKPSDCGGCVSYIDCLAWAIAAEPNKYQLFDELRRYAIANDAWSEDIETDILENFIRKCG